MGIVEEYNHGLPARGGKGKVFEGRSLYIDN